jgi:hypothetical protein
MFVFREQDVIANERIRFGLTFHYLRQRMPTFLGVSWRQIATALQAGTSPDLQKMGINRKVFSPPTTASSNLQGRMGL